MDKNTAIDKIMAEAAKLNGIKPIHYAATYARIGRHMTGEGWRVQCLYILSNLNGWRGDEAKEVKEFLKKESKR